MLENEGRQLGRSDIHDEVGFLQSLEGSGVGVKGHERV